MSRRIPPLYGEDQRPGPEWEQELAAATTVEEVKAIAAKAKIVKSGPLSGSFGNADSHKKKQIKQLKQTRGYKEPRPALGDKKKRRRKTKKAEKPTFGTSIAKHPHHSSSQKGHGNWARGGAVKTTGAPDYIPLEDAKGRKAPEKKKASPKPKPAPKPKPKKQAAKKPTPPKKKAPKKATRKKPAAKKPKATTVDTLGKVDGVAVLDVKSREQADDVLEDWVMSGWTDEEFVDTEAVLDSIPDPPQEAQWAITEYKSSSFGVINDYLRNGEEAIARQNPDFVKLMDLDAVKEVVDRLNDSVVPAPDDMTLFRGFSVGPFKPPPGGGDLMGSSQIIGRTFTDKAFMSTAITPMSARSFGNTILAINVPKGTGVIDVGNLDEEEVVLAANTSIKVTGVVDLDNTGLRVVWADVVSSGVEKAARRKPSKKRHPKGKAMPMVERWKLDDDGFVAAKDIRKHAKVDPSSRPNRRSLAKIAVFRPDLDVTELDADKNLVFGWASIAIQKDGSQLSDLQGHSIDIDDLEQAAYNFTIDYRKTGEMHSGESLGEMVESFVVTPDKLEQMGLAPDALPLGWWVGFKVPPTVFAKVKSGKYRMFSIQGKATLEPFD